MSENLQSLSRSPLRSSIVGVVGVTLAVVSTYCVWFQFSDGSISYILTGIQTDEFLRESYSYNLFTGVVYFSVVLVMIGAVLTLAKPFEQLMTRCANAFFLFIASMVVAVPIIRVLTIQGFAWESLQYFSYGFWLIIVSVELLLFSWVLSLLEIRQASGKFEIILDRIGGSLRGVESEIEMWALAKKCRVSQKLLREVLGKSKENFPDFYICANKIANKQWLREMLKEKLT